jgi:hypothetical protein
MGYSAGLYVIPATKFAAAQEKGTWARYHWHKCEPWFDLGNTWYELNEVLQQRSTPLSYSIEGNVRPTPDELGFDFVSPDVVAQIAVALGRIPTEEVVDEIERQRGQSWTESERAGLRECYADSFEELRKAYRTAAARGAAVGILIC